MRSESLGAEHSNGAAERHLTVAAGFSRLKPTATITSSLRALRLAPMDENWVANLLQNSRKTIERRYALLPILTCEARSRFGAVYGKVDQTGVAHWSEKNVRPDWLPDDIASWRRGPWSGAQVELTPRRAIHAVDWCMPVTRSQIGGLPSWVQDAEYPCCPECRRTMTFIAQLDKGHFPANEGIYYAFLCATCRITSTTYQQT